MFKKNYLIFVKQIWYFYRIFWLKFDILVEYFDLMFFIQIIYFISLRKIILFFWYIFK